MNGFSFRFRGRIHRLLTLYRLFQDNPGTFTAMSEDQAKARLGDLARKESLILYSAVTAIVLLLAIMMILVGPAV